MRRKNRIALRLYLLIVLFAGLFGSWYASNYWTPSAQSLQLPAFSDEGDLVEFIASLGEETILLILGMTSGGS
jgi:hypothetical protein